MQAIQKVYKKALFPKYGNTKTREKLSSAWTKYRYSDNAQIIKAWSKNN